MNKSAVRNDKALSVHQGRAAGSLNATEGGAATAVPAITVN